MNAVEIKARQCRVERWPDGVYSVESPSGATHEVTPLDEGASGQCTCSWGHIHAAASMEKGCSHMRAVWMYEQGRANDAQEADFQAGVDLAIETNERMLAAGFSEDDAAADADAMVGYVEQGFDAYWDSEG